MLERLPPHDILAESVADAYRRGDRARRARRCRREASS